VHQFQLGLPHGRITLSQLFKTVEKRAVLQMFSNKRRLLPCCLRFTWPISIRQLEFLVDDFIPIAKRVR
jgi:hypothetical protein